MYHTVFFIYSCKCRCMVAYIITSKAISTHKNNLNLQEAAFHLCNRCSLSGFIEILARLENYHTQATQQAPCPLPIPNLHTELGTLNHIAYTLVLCGISHIPADFSHGEMQFTASCACHSLCESLQGISLPSIDFFT